MSKLKQYLRSMIGTRNYMEWARRYNDWIVSRKEDQTVALPDEVQSFRLPLIYISQPPRCGGTITRNLFDGHPQLLVYPYELSWEKKGYHWEDDLAQDRATLLRLRDQWLTHAINHGFDKSIPFDFNRPLQEKIFLALPGGHSAREVLQAYLDSFFQAWRNFQNREGEKAYYLAFCPWNDILPDRVDRFFQQFPDGYRLHIVRDPRAWWASEKHYDEREKGMEKYLESRWLPATEHGVQLAHRYPDRYLLVSYEEMILQPEKTLRAICPAVGIDFHPILLSPTINSVPRVANSSHGLQRTQIDSSSLDKWQQKLSREEIDYLTQKTGPMLEQAHRLCINLK
jgi:hypothetical protein